MGQETAGVPLGRDKARETLFLVTFLYSFYIGWVDLIATFKIK